MNNKIIENLLQKYDKNTLMFSDKDIDQLLGLPVREIEKRIDSHLLTKQFGVEQYLYEGTPYSYIRYFLNRLSPAKNDIIYDLGSGYGRVILYGALTTQGYFKGIEIVPERVSTVLTAKEKFQIDNLECVNCNVLDYSFDDGTIFFLFNPFFRETLTIVSEKLQKIAQTRNIKIVTWGGSSNDYFSDQKWLNEKNYNDRDFSKIQFFESNLIKQQNV